MKKSIYARTKKKINRLGFGAWQLGNTEFWGHMSLEEGVALVKSAIRKGIHFFDTAPGYASGVSETIIGIAIKDLREKVVINTKFGHSADGTSDFSPSSMRESIYESLERLQTTYLDSIVLHNPSMDILEGKTTHFEELQNLKNEGLIKAFGVSIDTAEEMETTLNHINLDVIEILFNIFFQSPRHFFAKAKEKGVSIITKVPLDSGWLTGKYDEETHFEGIRSRWDDESLQRRGHLVRKLKTMTKSEDLTRYAIAFNLSFDAVTAVIPGIKNSKQLKQHLEYVDFVLDEDIKKAFIELYNQDIKDNPLPW
ncbi:MAG: aldo/keto reductase [Acholeplasmataceae bacterium]|nr:aldo/keto reductase [Acholeplasmataceae bacterium]